MERFHSYTNISRFSNTNLLQHACTRGKFYVISENMSGFSRNSAMCLRINVLKI